MPDAEDEYSLLLVDHRRVLEEYSYRLCPACPAAWLTPRAKGPASRAARAAGRRALAHARFRHPGRRWLTGGPRGRRTPRRHALCAEHTR